MHRILVLNTERGGRRGTTRPRSVSGPAPNSVLLLALAAAAPTMRAADLDDGSHRAPPRGNFVVHEAGDDRSRVILERAEAVRREAFRRLLGDDAPAPWRAPCHVHVHPSARSFAATLGSPPLAARGATSLEFGVDRVTRRRIDVMGDGPDVVPDALAHEIVHVVLGDRFTAAAPPRWADEGLALLFDPPDRQRRHDDDFREALRRGLAWTAADLLALEEYPPQAHRQRVFYGQSAALVRWLVARRDAPAFVAFAADCGPLGTGAALAKHYGIGSVAELDRAWDEVASVEAFAIDVPGTASGVTP